MDAEVSVATVETLSRAARKFKGSEGAREFMDSPHCLAYVARHDGEVVGWCWGYDLVRPDGTSMIYVHLLEVDEAMRRRGVGRQLVEAMLQSARDRNASKVFLITQQSNEVARRLYESLGGQHDESGPSLMFWWRFED